MSDITITVGPDDVAPDWLILACSKTRRRKDGGMDFTVDARERPAQVIASTPADS